LAHDQQQGHNMMMSEWDCSRVIQKHGCRPSCSVTHRVGLLD